MVPWLLVMVGWPPERRRRELSEKRTALTSALDKSCTSVSISARGPRLGRGQRVLKPDQASQVAERELEHRGRVVEREPEMTEDLHRHRAVEQHPAPEEDQDRAVGGIGAQLLAEPPELPAQYGIDVRADGHREAAGVPELKEQDVEGP